MGLELRFQWDKICKGDVPLLEDGPLGSFSDRISYQHLLLFSFTLKWSPTGRVPISLRP
jgi:hypothetical protein